MCHGAGSRGGSSWSGEDGLRVGGRGPLRLIQCVPRVFRNGVASPDVSHRCEHLRPPLECSVRSDELPVSMRMRMCVVMCWYANTLHETHHSTDNKKLSGPLEVLTKYLQDTRSPSAKITTQPLHALYTFPLRHLPPIRVLPCLHCRGEKGKPRLRAPKHFDEFGYSSATRPRSEARATAEDP